MDGRRQESVVADWFFSDLHRMDKTDADSIRPLLDSIVRAVDAVGALADGLESANAPLRGVNAPAVYHDCIQCEQKWLLDNVLPSYQQKNRLMLSALNPFRALLSELVDAAVAADDIWQGKIDQVSALSAQLEAHLAHGAS